MNAALPRLLLEPIISNALKEDLQRLGDLSSNALVAEETRTRARIVTRQEGVVAGLDVAGLVFEMLDGEISLSAQVADGDAIAAGETLLLVEGNARAILAAERTALNFLAHLSGIATATAKAVAAVSGTRARICCTRKTTPGLRVLEKHAVRLGGGVNHRFGLDDAILIKDNHLELWKQNNSGGIQSALQAARETAGHLVAIEIEVDSIEQLEEALQAKAAHILLDNMSLPDLKRAVEITKGRAMLEASGGITPERVGEVAKTGVDLISLGALTHSSAALDVSLEVERQR